MTRPTFLALLVLPLFAACSSEDPAEEPSGSGGTVSSGGGTQPGTGGALGSGGTTSGGSSATGGATLGTVATGGAMASGGATATGGAEATGGASVDESGGMPGTGGDEGTGGTSNEPSPSDGCGKANPQTGSSGGPLMVSGHQYYVKLPTNYDENTPYPVIMMFNPTGNPITWAEQNAGYEKNSAKDEAIRVYPHMSNQNNGWNQQDEAFFVPFHEKVLADYCVDKDRVFAAGESSGGDFVAVVGCKHGDLLRAIAPTAVKSLGGWFDFSSSGCVGPVASVVIYSTMDNVLAQPAGEQTQSLYHELNQCSDMSEPVTGYTDNMSNCVQFSGCQEGYPSYLCLHSDPTYSNTYHGWPAFAGDMTWEVFQQF